MERADSVEEYIEKHQEWHEQLVQLREIINKTELSETIKWGAPTYTLKNKNIVGLGAFKSYVGIWFFNGSFLKDEANVLFNAQEGKTKGLRQWRFAKEDALNEALILNYVQQAIDNEKAGKRIKPARDTNKTVSIPEELATAFKEVENLESSFNQLTFYKQKEFAIHVGDAKKAETREKRLTNAIPLILAGKGLHDKYKNC